MHRLRSFCGALCFALLPAATHAQSGQLWRADDRVMLSDFSYVGAVATDSRRVYAATTNGLEIYDYTRQRWELPSTLEAGYPVGERPTALAVDPLQSELILATTNGLTASIWRFRLIDRRWERGATVQSRGVLAIIPAPSIADDAIWLRTVEGWMRLGRIGIFADPVSPSAVPAQVRERAARSIERLERDPGIAAYLPQVTFDEYRQRWPLTSAAAEEFGAGVWIGRAGGHFARLDTRSYRIENFGYGLVAAGVSAIARDDTGALWFGADGRGQRNGLTRVAADLSSSTRLESTFDRTPSRAVSQIIAVHDTIWVAALDGLYRCACAGSKRSLWERFGERDGLPVSEVTTLAATAGGLWVGTRRGLVHWSGTRGTARFVGQRIHRLAAYGDTLLIATDRGLWLMSERDSVGDGVVAPAPVPGGTIVDVAAAGSVLYATDGNSLYRRSDGVWSGPERVDQATGRVVRLVATPTHLWIAGQRGVAVRDFATGAWLTFAVPDDVPAGPVSDLLVTGDDVWVATPAGAMRLRWRR